MNIPELVEKARLDLIKQYPGLDGPQNKDILGDILTELVTDTVKMVLDDHQLGISLYQWLK